LSRGICCGAWIRTKIRSSKGFCPTVRRPRKILKIIYILQNFKKMATAFLVAFCKNLLKHSSFYSVFVGVGGKEKSFISSASLISLKSLFQTPFTLNRWSTSILFKLIDSSRLLIILVLSPK
jgi:hypothetical protein